MSKPHLIDDLLKRCVTFDEDEQSSEVKLRMAVDLNWIVARVEYHLTTSHDESDIAFAQSALRIVELTARNFNVAPIEAAHIDIGEGSNS